MEKELSPKQKDAIREGIMSEGFPKFIAEAVRIREYESQDKSHVFTLTLEFKASVVMTDDDSYNPPDPFTYIGRKFGKDLQVQMVRLLPGCRIEDKVIMHVKEYDHLRRKAAYSESYPMYDSEFGRHFGTHP